MVESIIEVLLLALFVVILSVYRRRVQKREKQLEASEARFQAIFEVSPIGMSQTDQKGILVAANRAFEEMLGYSWKDLKGIRLQDLTHESDVGADQHLFKEITTGKRSNYQIEKRYISKTGEEVWVRATCFVVEDDEGQSLYVAMHEDISKRKQSEKALKTRETQLAVQYAATKVLAEPALLEEMIPRLLQTLGDGIGWDAGGFWKADEATNALRCVHFWRSEELAAPDFQLSNETPPVGIGVALVGRVWAKGQTYFVKDMGQDQETLRALKGSRKGLRSAFCFPVIVDGAVRCVLEFCSESVQRLDDDVLQALTDICAQVSSQLGRILEREEAVETLRVSEERYRTITEISSDAIITVDNQATILSANRAVESVFGFAAEELVGEPLTVLVPERVREVHTEELRRFFQSGERHLRWEKLELPAVHKSGKELLIEVSLSSLVQNGKPRFTGYMRDVTDRKREESALLYQALHDALTDLPNRALLHERLQRAILIAKRQSSSLALLFMDLNRFKEVNDTFGHHSGDVLLKQVAFRLEGTLRESDTVARLGGDEFAVLLPSADEVGATLAANRITDVLKRPFSLESQTFDIGASVGIALFPQHGEDSDSLMRRADSAMYTAKRMSGGYEIYSPDQDKNSAVRLRVTGELRRAIENNELLLHYQPKIKLVDGSADQVEALIRWHHPQRGITSPDGFIPLAEDTGLVKPLTAWVLNEALRQHKEWRNMGLDVKVAVNFSARTLHEPDLVETVCELLEESEVEPSRLQIEITESSIMLDPDRARDALTRLHKVGIWTSIDDFGTGYSSLGYLKQLPVDEIKIDKSFVVEMSTNRDDALIVDSVITLGHNLGLQVVAEGVDNKRTLDMLGEMGCDLAQGYFLSRPAPSLELASWFNGRRVSLRGVA